MLVTVILLSITCEIVQSSGHHALAPAGLAPVVTAASSQYFERTFNRLVAVPPVLESVLPVAPAPIGPAFSIAPVLPIAPARPVLSVLPAAPVPPVVVDATRTTAVPANPTNPSPPSVPVDPNVAIAVATAHAAAPVATILLPPYPFGFPPSFGLIPQQAQIPTENTNTRESTTKKTTTTVQATTTQQAEATTPLPSNVDNNFDQALPSNDNFNFRQYLTPQLPIPRPGPQQLPLPDLRPQQSPLPVPRPQQNLVPVQRPQNFPLPAPRPQQVPQQLPLPDLRPQKVKTHVEIVPVPLAYIAPPEPHHHEHHHHHHPHHHHHQSLKVVPHIHTFIPKTSKIIIRPVTAPLRIRMIRVPGFAKYGPPRLQRKVALKQSQNIMTRSRDTEPTTLRPVNRPLTKPPRV